MIADVVVLVEVYVIADVAEQVDVTVDGGLGWLFPNKFIFILSGPKIYLVFKLTVSSGKKNFLMY
jgi:hypothetical protein